MEIKDYLAQATRIDLMIDSKLGQLASLKKLSKNVQVNLKSSKIGDEFNGDRIIKKIIDYEGKIKEEIDRIVNLKKNIVETIHSVSDINCQLVLEMRYVDGRGWDEVADVMGYDKRTVYRIHVKALKEIASCHSMSLNSSMKV